PGLYSTTEFRQGGPSTAYLLESSEMSVEDTFIDTQDRRGERDLGMTTGTERAGLAAARATRRAFLSQRLRDYVTLTKPRIIALLLVTPLAPMVLAVDGWPGWAVVGWTMLG